MRFKNILILLFSFIILTIILGSTLSIFKIVDATAIYDKFGALIISIFVALKNLRIFAVLPFIIQIVCYFLFFVVVIVIQFGAYKIILQKIDNFGKVFKSIFCGNILSLLLCVALYLLVFFVTSGHRLSYLDIGSFNNLKTTFGIYFGGIGFLLHNICYLLISYYSEWTISLKLLKDDYEDKKIKNSVLLSNGLKHILPILSSVIIMAQGQDINNIKMFLESEPGYFSRYCFGIIILPILLVGLGIFMTKKYNNKQKEKIIQKEN